MFVLFFEKNQNLKNAHTNISLYQLQTFILLLCSCRTRAPSSAGQTGLSHFVCRPTQWPRIFRKTRFDHPAVPTTVQSLWRRAARVHTKEDHPAPNAVGPTKTTLPHRNVRC